KILYGEGTKTERDRAYADAMDRMHRAHPDDLEAQTFDALAKLGLSQDLNVNTRLQMEAGALALDAYEKNPNHPGAAHYVIHSFDDPDHAILALPAARRYAQIAPDAPHARHMPAHIFVQLGMWPEAIESNIAAVRVSQEFYAKRKGEEWKFDTHSGHWLMDLYLEEGRRKPAQETLTLDASVVAHTRIARAEGNYAETVLGWLTETGTWDRSEELLAPLFAEKLPDTSVAASSATPTPAPTAAPAPATGGVARGCAAHESTSFGPPFAELKLVTIAEVRGYAASAKGDVKTAKKQAEAVHASIAKVEDPQYKAQIEDQELMLRAEIARASGKTADAVALLRKCIEIEKTLPPPSGPAEGFVPAERLGEILLATGKPAEAADAFAVAMAQHQGRARSILGAARAEKALGHSAKASELYARVAAIWKDADADWPGVAEARAATAHADAR
ncbi:MAG TPA: hypothetical protein VMV18_07445, partial [bacterium]|nr:hypothetical protein [bacterium]